MLLKNIVLALSLLGTALQQVPLPESMLEPKIHERHHRIQEEVSPFDSIVSITFPQINFEVGMQFYVHNGELADERIFNKSLYDQELQHSCVDFPTSLDVDFVSRQAIPQENKILKYMRTRYGNNYFLFLLLSNSQLVQYNVSPAAIEIVHTYNVSSFISIVDGQLIQNVEMTQLDSFLYIFSSESAHRINFVDQGSVFSGMGAYSAFGKSISGCGWMEGNTLWVSTEQQIFIYGLDGSTFTPLQTISNFTSESISAIHFDNQLQAFHVVTLSTFYIFYLENPAERRAYQLHGVCNEISKKGRIVYLGCQYERINYVIEMRVEGLEAAVNRYFDDASLEGVRKVEALGFDKVALIGDDELMMLGEGINQNVILDLERRNKEQNRHILYTYNLIDVLSLDSFSTPSTSHILTITPEHVALYNIKQVPPEVECVFSSDVFSNVSCLLITFNTTHCPNEKVENQALGGSDVICETSYPFHIKLGVKEYEARTANFILLICLFAMLTAVLVCAGCGMQIRTRANDAILSLEERIEKMRREREMAQRGQNYQQA